MPTLQQVVQQNYQGQTSAAIEADLAATVQIMAPDSSPWTYDAVAMDSRFGVAVGEAIGNALVAAGLNLAAQLFVVKGIDVSLPETQAELAALLAALNAVTPKNTALISALTMFQQLGQGASGPKWGKLGLSSLPAIADIDEALKEVSIINAVSNWLNETWNVAIGSNTATASQLKTLVSNLNTTIQGM